jgi:hypothetical protein
MRAKLISIILVLTGPFLVVGGFQDGMKRAKIEKEGVAAEATVTGGEERRRRKGGKSYNLDLAVPQATKEHNVSVSKEIYDSAGIGSRIPIKQLPSDPDAFFLVGDSDDHVMMEVIGVLLFLVGGGMVWWCFIRKPKPEAVV